MAVVTFASGASGATVMQTLAPTDASEPVVMAAPGKNPPMDLTIANWPSCKVNLLGVPPFGLHAERRAPLE